MLKTLASRGSLHGYGICAHIQQVSEDALRVEEGSLYPALHRMEQEGWVKAQWRMTEHGRQARYYELTGAGRGVLEAEVENWSKLTGAVGRVLRFSEA